MSILTLFYEHTFVYNECMKFDQYSLIYNVCYIWNTLPSKYADSVSMLFSVCLYEISAISGWHSVTTPLFNCLNVSFRFDWPTASIYLHNLFGENIFLIKLYLWYIRLTSPTLQYSFMSSSSAKYTMRVPYWFNHILHFLKWRNHFQQLT